MYIVFTIWRLALLRVPSIRYYGILSGVSEWEETGSWGFGGEKCLGVRRTGVSENRGFRIDSSGRSGLLWWSNAREVDGS